MDKNDPRQQPTDEELDELNEHWREPGDPDGVVAAEERQQWREINPAAAVPPPVVQRKKRRWLRALTLLVLLVAATYGAYWFGDHQAAAPSSQPATSAPTIAKKPAVKKPVATPTKQYESTNFSLALEYPATWKVTDSTAKLTLTSPDMPMTKPDGTNVNSRVLVTVQKKQASILGYPAGAAVAVLESQKLTYTQPSAMQRAQTYVTFLSYKQADGLDAVYVTGDYGYVQSQAVPMSDIVASDPLIGVSFVGCSTADCASSAPMPLTLRASSWQAAPMSAQINKLLESIQFQ